MSTERPELHWHRAANARKFHVVDSKSSRLLCGGVLFGGTLDQPVDWDKLGPGKGPNDCAQCWKRLDKIRSATA